MKRRYHSLIALVSNTDYYRLMFKLALPIMLQSLIMSALNMVALLFVGQLGETSVAAVGLSGQIWFLLSLFVFGVVSGASIFIAQFWGKEDISNIRKVEGLTLVLSFIVALFFWAVAVFFPEMALGIYSKDPKVVELGSQYLCIYGWSYLFYTISYVYSAALRSTGDVKLPMAVSTCALGLNVIMTYPFIFGWKFIGLHAMGIQGAAIAGLLARIIECLAILLMIYRNPKSPAAARIGDIFNFDVKYLITVLKPVLPVIINEILWSLGITTYNIIYGHIGTNAVAAINIISTIEQVAWVVFQGVGTATAILVGNQIGRGMKEEAFMSGGRTLVFQALGGMVMGGVISLFAGFVINLYKVDPIVVTYSKAMVIVLSLGIWIKACNNGIIIGILRAGGDTKFSLVLDGLVIWFVGVPVLAIGAFIFDLPIYYVYALTFVEEIVKVAIGGKRYLSRKWINDFTLKVEPL